MELRVAPDDLACLTEVAVAEILASYADYRFVAERDIEWTLQKKFVDYTRRWGLGVGVWHQYPLPGGRADVALGSERILAATLGAEVEVAIELKYEPLHSRTDVRRTRLPVCSFGAVFADVERAKGYVASGKAKIAYAIFVDEGGYYRWRDPHADAVWKDFILSDGSKLSIHWARFGS